MSRGLFIFLVQMIAGVGVTGIGIWALARPKHLQHFVNSNFALLPEVKNTMQFTTFLIRLLGVFALWDAYTLLAGIYQELTSLLHWK